jgi:hypothetical protein
MLRDCNREARAVCSRPWLKGLALAVPVAAVAAAIALSLAGKVAVTRDVLVAATGVNPLLGALRLPINTPARGRVFRGVKWVAMTGAFVLILGADAPKSSWLLIHACGLWPGPSGPGLRSGGSCRSARGRGTCIFDS